MTIRKQTWWTMIIHIFVLTIFLAREFFCYPLIGTEINFFTYLDGTSLFFHIYCLAQSFSLVLTFPGLRIEAALLSTVHGKCIYTIYKVQNQETQFPLLCTYPSIDKHKIFILFISHLGLACTVSLADLSAICATIVESSGSICRPSMPNRRVFWVDLQANRSQRVIVKCKINKKLCENQLRKLYIP